MVPTPQGPPGEPLRPSFYARETTQVARLLLGNYVCRLEEDGTWTWGRIVETEAYRGEDDPACHAASGKTPRNRPMYGPPGRSYVYFTYGMHHMLNVVTETEGYPAAVLIRALEPLGGLETLISRRGTRDLRLLTSGPARLCQALGINLAWNDRALDSGCLLICQGSKAPAGIASGPRIGIRVGLEKDWRFWDRTSGCLSRP